MINKMIKKFLLCSGFCYIKFCNIFLGKLSCCLKRIIERIFLEFLTIWVILAIFVSLIIKHPFWATLITAFWGAIFLWLKQKLQTIIEHYNEITERPYKKHSLEDAYKELKKHPLEKLLDPTLERKFNESRKKTTIR